MTGARAAGVAGAAAAVSGLELTRRAAAGVTRARVAGAATGVSRLDLKRAAVTRAARWRVGFICNRGTSVFVSTSAGWAVDVMDYCDGGIGGVGAAAGAASVMHSVG